MEQPNVQSKTEIDHWVCDSVVGTEYLFKIILSWWFSDCIFQINIATFFQVLVRNAKVSHSPDLWNQTLPLDPVPWVFTSPLANSDASSRMRIIALGHSFVYAFIHSFMHSFIHLIFLPSYHMSGTRWVSGANRRTNAPTVAIWELILWQGIFITKII